MTVPAGWYNFKGAQGKLAVCLLRFGIHYFALIFLILSALILDGAFSKLIRK
jgi:hypothetical protein